MSVYIDNKVLTLNINKKYASLDFKLKNKKFINSEYSLNKIPQFHISLSRDEDRFSFTFHFLFINIFLRYAGLKKYIVNNDLTWEYSFYIYDWTFWWNLGRPLHSWKSRDWRHSNFKLLDFLFGDQKLSKTNQLEIDKIIKLPEGDYSAHMIFEDYNYTRTRIPKFIWKKIIRRVDLKIEPEIPYPGKNSPVSGYSQVSFPAKDVEEVLDNIYKNIKEKRKGDIGYYKNAYRKIVDNFIYTVNDLPINIGRVILEKHNKEWTPIGISTSGVADSKFKELMHKDSLSLEEVGFINKYMGKRNSISFIQDKSKNDLQKEMEEFFKNRNMQISCGYSENNYAVSTGGKL